MVVVVAVAVVVAHMNIRKVERLTEEQARGMPLEWPGSGDVSKEKTVLSLVSWFILGISTG